MGRLPFGPYRPTFGGGPAVTTMRTSSPRWPPPKARSPTTLDSRRHRRGIDYRDAGSELAPRALIAVIGARGFPGVYVVGSPAASRSDSSMIRATRSTTG